MLKVKILIVDDEKDYCLLMKRYFQSKGYEVFVSFRLMEGLSILQTIGPSILILDNNLPDGNGWDCCPEISKKFPGLQIHLVSAYRQKSAVDGFAPDVMIWEKPISFSQLENSFASQT